MHDPVPQTGQWLQSVVQGYFNYYAVSGILTLPLFRLLHARLRRSLRRPGRLVPATGSVLVNGTRVYAREG